MPTRAEILDTLAASQTQVMAFFQGLSPEDLERPATASEVPGAAPWRAKDHFAHLVKSERNIQRLLRCTLAGDTRDVLLRSQYPAGMEMPGILGDLSALTPEEEERLGMAVASVNQTYVNEHHDDSMEMVAADYLAARQETISWPLWCPLSLVSRPLATCLPGERGMQPRILPGLRKDFVRACDTPNGKMKGTFPTEPTIKRLSSCKAEQPLRRAPSRRAGRLKNGPCAPSSDAYSRRVRGWLSRLPR